MPKALRMARRSAEERTTYIRFKATEIEVKALDQWCLNQRFPPSRAEAVRRLTMQVVMTETKSGKQS